MIEEDRRKAIYLLHEVGMTVYAREGARTVRLDLSQPPPIDVFPYLGECLFLEWHRRRVTMNTLNTLWLGHPNIPIPRSGLAGRLVRNDFRSHQEVPDGFCVGDDDGFVPGIFWKRGTKQAAMTTMFAGRFEAPAYKCHPFATSSPSADGGLS